MSLVDFDSWPLGINNRAPVNRLPEGSARDMVNLTPSATGKLSLRPGYAKVSEVSAVRGAVPHGKDILLFSGQDILLFSPAGEASRKIGETKAAAGAVAGASLGDVTYLCTPADKLRVIGDKVMPWGVEAPATKVTLVPGSLPPGIYQIALTAMTSDGVESGAIPVIIDVPAGKAFSVPVVLTDGAVSVRCYCSVDNGDTLYFVGEKVSGAFAISSLPANGARLTTRDMVSSPVGSSIVAHNASLLITVGNILYVTEPYMPHLHNRLRGFFQFPANIDMVLSVGDYVFVCADKTYRIENIELNSAGQTEVAGFGAVRGTGINLPDGSGTWMTKYGQAVASLGGTLEFPTQKSYAPPITERGTAAILECDGNQVVVTTMRGRILGDGLGLRDSYDLEIE